VGLLALSGPGTIASPGLLLLIFGALMAPAIIWTFVPTLWAVAGATTLDARAVAVADARDLIRGVVRTSHHGSRGPKRCLVSHAAVMQ
jgi:hypothetical protein